MAIRIKSSLIWLLFSIISLCSAEENDYKLVRAETRNVIFVGRSRAGKTALIDVLKNKDYHPPLFTIVRGTEEVTLESFTMRVKGSEQYKNFQLQLNIMDTPGLFERTIDINDQRTNEIILDTIKKCIELEITKINHVYFVMSIQQGLNTEDLKSFRLFAELFLGMEHKISVIISFAQNLSTQKQYDHYIDQFTKVADLRSMYEKINGRIFFLGAISTGAMYDIATLKRNVYQQRRLLFQHILKQTSSYNLKKLKIYQDYLLLIKQVRLILAECCTNMQTCIDIARFDLFIKHYTDFVEGNVRNIVFIGRSGAGKTTLIEILKDKYYVPDQWWNMFTKTDKCTTYSIDGIVRNLDVNIMDTPGLINNIKYIKKCIEDINEINHIYFIISMAHGLNPDEMHAFKLFTELFAGIEKHLSIIISFSHTFTSKEYDHYRDQFKTVPVLKHMYDTTQGRIFFLGAVEDCKVCDVNAIKRNVYAQRDILISHFEEQDTVYNVQKQM
eukprot:298711_1